MPLDHRRQSILMACLRKPYRPGAAGPDAYDCFGLVGHLGRALYGFDLPTDGDAILKARRLFRAVPLPIADGTIVVMRQGDQHVGLWLEPERLVIHAVERRGVTLDTLHALQLGGFGRPRFFARR